MFELKESMQKLVKENGWFYRYYTHYDSMIFEKPPKETSITAVVYIREDRVIVRGHENIDFLISRYNISSSFYDSNNKRKDWTDGTVDRDIPARRYLIQLLQSLDSYLTEGSNIAECEEFYKKYRIPEDDQVPKGPSIIKLSTKRPLSVVPEEDNMIEYPTKLVVNGEEAQQGQCPDERYLNLISQIQNEKRPNRKRFKPKGFTEKEVFDTIFGNIF